MESRLVKERLKRMRASEAELAREMGVNPSTLWRFLSGKAKRSQKPLELALGVAMDRLEVKIRSELTRSRRLPVK